MSSRSALGALNVSARGFPARLWEVLSSGFFFCEGDALLGIREGDAL